MGNERKKINLTDIDEDSIVASFKEAGRRTGRRKQPGTRNSPVKRADMSVCSSTSHRSAHGLARQSIFVRSFMNGFRGSSRQSGTTRCPFSAMWTMCWNSTLPPIRTRSRRNTENEVPNCFKPRKPCQQSYSYLSAAICCG